MTADEFRSLIAQKEAARAPFCALWIASGAEARTSAELIELAERAGLPIPGRTTQTRLISFGRWLGTLASCSIKSDGIVYQIAPATKRDGYSRWQITVDPKSESESVEKLPVVSIF